MIKFPGTVFEMVNNRTGKRDVRFYQDISFNERSELTSGPVLLLDDGYFIKQLHVTDPIIVGGGLTATSESGHDIAVRQMSEYDAVFLSPIMTYPVPISVLEGLLRRSNMPELSALVDDEGDVMTLMLSTDEGVYLRFDGAWRYLPPESDPNPVDGMTVVDVAGDAVDVFDDADIHGRTPSIMKFLLAEGEEYTGIVRQDLADSTEQVILGEVNTNPEEQTLVSAASLISYHRVQYPVIASIDDLNNAIQIANNEPSIRWYVEKRIRALGADVHIPWSI